MNKLLLENSRKKLKVIIKELFLLSQFVLITFVGLLVAFLSSLGKKIGFFLKLAKKIRTFYLRLDTNRDGGISRVDLIEISLANLRAKKSRTYITIGGVVVGIMTVVLLVSIGYGLQKMVISRVARLDEMRQIDVYTQSGSKLTISDKTLSDIQGISGVDSVLPIISVVGRVSYMKSVSDLAVYGVTTDLLRESAIQPVSGKIFDSNELSNQTNQPGSQVKGVSIENTVIAEGEKIRDISIEISDDKYLRLREAPDRKAILLGYATQAGLLRGQEVWGKSYLDEEGRGEAGTDADGNKLGKWVKITVPLYEKNGSDYLPVLDENNNPVVKEGFLAEIDMTIKNISGGLSPQVLGKTTNIASPQASIVSIKDGWVEIASESATKETLQIDKVEISPNAKKVAVVNRSMLTMMGLKENEAVGKEFNVSFIVTGNLLSDDQKRIESVPTQYKIVAVTPDNKTAQFFVPFIDIRSLGVVNFSQAKVIVKNQNDLPRIRKQIESLGYKTRSVVDTVNQINQLFGTLRTFLALLGLVALFVAAVGMFNTLTVSLMERTREVGLLKAMGMKSSEIKELFLAESLIMSGSGGLLGVICGILVGKIIEILLSTFSLFKGAGFISISYTPPLFGFTIILLAVVVGFITGFYPARRATKISALDALRYE